MIWGKILTTIRGFGQQFWSGVPNSNMCRGTRRGKDLTDTIPFRSLPVGSFFPRGPWSLLRGLVAWLGSLHVCSSHHLDLSEAKQSSS